MLGADTFPSFVVPVDATQTSALDHTVASYVTVVSPTP